MWSDVGLSMLLPHLSDDDLLWFRSYPRRPQHRANQPFSLLSWSAMPQEPLPGYSSRSLLEKAAVAIVELTPLFVAHFSSRCGA